MQHACLVGNAMREEREGRHDPLVMVAAELAEVKALLSSIGATDGEYLHHVVQTLLDRPHNPYRPAVALLVARAASGAVPEQVIRFAAAIQIIAVAALTHRRTAADASLVPAEQPNIDSRLVVLAGDYLYAQAAYMTAGLQNLNVMAILAEEIKRQCRGEVARHNGHAAAGAAAGLYSLSAVGAGFLLDCDTAAIAELRQYGAVLDRVDAAALAGEFRQEDTASLLSGTRNDEWRGALLDLVDAIPLATPYDGLQSDRKVSGQYHD
jgi:geranylgeranyl pyrophosphate synthase